MQIPLIGLGTWELTGKECTNTIKQALDLGYRHIDTAHVYENHQAVQKGIHGWKREELFITTKLSLDQVNFDKIEQSVEAACNLALKELDIDYIDLYLLHWPDHKKPLSKVFKAMELLAASKKVLHVGVSNFTIHHLEDLRKDLCHPAANQVEFHPHLFQKELLDYCNQHKIKLIAYRPLGKGKLLQDPLIHKLAKSHAKTPGQIALRWLTQKNIPAIPKASSLEHLRENLHIFDFSLTPQEMHELDMLHRNLRYCSPEDEEFRY
jgi:diketogulonate reductase-like aldo/keto reductase